MRYRHVIFDLDGTLVDTLDDIRNALNSTLASMGCPPLDRDPVRRAIGAGVRMLVTRALGPAYADRIDEGVELFRPRYAAHLTDHTRPYPGTVETLATLHAAGVALTVLTNKPIAFSTAILRGLNLERFFVAIVGGDSLATRKPDPAGVDALLVRTGTRRGDTLLVGDSSIDVDTSRNAGIAFCGVGWGFGADELRMAGIGPLLEAPGELVGLVCDA